MFTPLNWLLVFLLLIIFLKSRKWKKVFGWLAAIMFILFSSPVIYQFYARWWQPEPTVLPANAHYSFAIVAGGFASADAAGGGYFNSAADRFLQAVKLFQTGKVDRVLISGGNSKEKDKTFTEAAWSKKEMISMGVPDSVIFIEDASSDTKGNAVHTRRIIDSLHAQPPFVLITSAFHMPRAQKIFQKEGLEVIPFPCNYTEGRGPFVATDLIPDPGLLSAWSKYIRETLWWIVKG